MGRDKNSGFEVRSFSFLVVLSVVPPETACVLYTFDFLTPEMYKILLFTALFIVFEQH